MSKHTDNLSLADLQSVVPRKSGAYYQCPAYGCSQWKLQFYKHNGLDYPKCFNPKCQFANDVEGLLRVFREKFNARAKHNGKHDISTYPGLTLAEYALNKALPKEFLVWRFGLFNTTWTDYETGVARPGVAFPYFQHVNGTWEWVGSKIRMGSSHQSRWQWQRGFNKSSMTLFGLYDFRDGAIIPDIIICEGESNTQTLAFYDLPAVGVPGSKTWKSEWAQLHPIRGAKRVFIHQDPDGAGEEFVRKVAADLPGKEVLALKLNVKDPSDLHIARRDEPLGGNGAFGRSREQDAFIWEFNKAVQNAEPPTQSPVEVLPEPEPVMEEPLPALPSISGPLSELAHAVAPDLPYELKIASAMTFLGLAVAGRVIFDDAWYHEPRFYACMVSDPGLGKTPSWTEIEASITGLLDHHGVYRLHSVETGPALTMHLNEHPRTILVPDEFSTLFGKGASQQTVNGPTKSLMGELLKLYEKHHTANTARKNVEEVGRREVSVTDARLAIVGGVPTEEFPNMWSGTSGASTGLQDRTSLFTTTQTTLPAVQRPTDTARVKNAVMEIEANIRDAGTVTRPPAVAAMLNEWWSTTEPKLKGTRAGQRVKGFVDKFLLLQCALQGLGTATEALTHEAIRLGEYQIALKQRLMPEDASSWVSTAENKLLAYVKRQGKIGATMTNAINAIHPARCGGYGVAVRAWKNIIEANQIVQDRKVGTGGKPRVYWTATST